MVDVVRLATGGYAKIQNGVAVTISKEEADQIIGESATLAPSAATISEIPSVPPSTTLPRATVTVPDLGIPACDPTAGPRAEGRNGYDWDAFSGPAQLADTHPPSIPFHNMRQIHVSEIAWGAGITAPSIKEIPACPPKWTDVQHYWVIVSLSGWLFYEYGLNSKTSIAIRIAELGGAMGVLGLLQTYVFSHISIMT